MWRIQESHHGGPVFTKLTMQNFGSGLHMQLTTAQTSVDFCLAPFSDRAVLFGNMIKPWN